MVEPKYKKTLTIQEFRELFKIDEKYVITKSHVNQFVKMFRGSYLLWLEYNNINEKTFKLQTVKRTIKVIPTFDRNCTRSYQEFIQNISSVARINVDSYLSKNGENTCHFWSYTEFDNFNAGRENSRNLTKQIWRSAYQVFIGKFLMQMKVKYLSKYGITLKYRDFSTDRSSPGIWLDGVIFSEIVMFTKDNSSIKNISSYQICQVICQQYNIWCGVLPGVLKTLIDEIHENKSVKHLN